MPSAEYSELPSDPGALGSTLSLPQGWIRSSYASGNRAVKVVLAEHPADEWTGPGAAFLALALASRGDERDAASVALAALADYLPVYSASVRSYAIELAARE